MEGGHKPGKIEDKGTVDSPVLQVRDARAVKTVVFGHILPGGGWVLPGNRLVVKIWSASKGEEQDREELGQDGL